MLTNLINKIKSAPKDPGVYIFYRNQEPLYVGKASNLKNRLQNYLKITDLKTAAFHKEATDLKLLKLRSNIEALIIESKLIKELKPKYNILWRDDKNYFYVAITKEKFPRVYIGHQLNNPNTEYVGPFTEGNSLKAILRLLRRFFPYCTCKPHLRLCLNSQIGNCPGYCCTKNSNIRSSDDLNIDKNKQSSDDQNIKIYKKNIAKIKNILTGKDKKFIRQLKDPYELLVLEKIWQHQPYLEKQRRTFSIEQHANYLLKRSPSPVLRGESPQRSESGARGVEERSDEIARAKGSLLNEKVLRVESYDNSHLSGKEAVGAMTAWKKENGIWVADKNMWRKFKIRGKYTEDDPRMMEEIVSRRLNHPEWPYPDLIIIDGGITQFNAAKRALNKILRPTNYGLRPKVISFAKPQQLIFGLEKNTVPISKLPLEFQNLIKMAIQNTHNFVIRYHRKIRGIKFIKEYN